MVFELVLGFLALVAASYVGTTMALRNFFDGERYDSDGNESDGPPGTGESRRTDDGQRADNVQRPDDVPRAGDVADDDEDE